MINAILLIAMIACLGAAGVIHLEVPDAYFIPAALNVLAGALGFKSTVPRTHNPT
jgi:hypothetical protein